MKTMKLTLIGDPVLREKAGPVEQFDDSLRQTLDGMVKLMRKKSGVGLAAPQIGIKKRFFVVQVPGEEPLFFVNPEIIGTSMEMSDFEEGCLSVPGVWGVISRPSSIQIQAQNGDGKFFRLSADGYLARIIQHEYDHLNGILFVDHFDEKQSAKYQKKLKKAEPAKK